MAAWLAGGLAAILVLSAALGQAQWGSSAALGLVLTAVPTLPLQWRPALGLIAIRGGAVVAGALVVVLADGHVPVLSVATVVAAVVGARWDRIGPTAGLAVILIAVDAGAETSAALLIPCAVGIAVVAVAWLAWYACTRALGGARDAEPPADAANDPDPRRTRRAHALRVGIGVGIAVAVVAQLPADLVGGHWLITCVLLTVQPAATETGLRLAQRLSGNTVGALIAALLLGAHPVWPLAAGVTVALFILAMALRPVNYTWWAVTGPPVLLVISEYPEMFPWYEGGVRLAMNMAGAAIVVAVVFAGPAFRRWQRRE